MMKRIDRCARIAATLHTGDVESVTLGVIANGESKRQGVFNNNGVTTDVGFFADTAKLVHAGIRANVGAIFDHHVPGQCRCVCHDDAVAYQTVMSNMRLGHYQTLVADLRPHAAARRPAINADEFTTLTPLPDSRR